MTVCSSVVDVTTVSQAHASLLAAVRRSDRARSCSLMSASMVSGRYATIPHHQQFLPTVRCTSTYPHAPARAPHSRTRSTKNPLHCVEFLAPELFIRFRRIMLTNRCLRPLLNRSFASTSTASQQSWESANTTVYKETANDRKKSRQQSQALKPPPMTTPEELVRQGERRVQRAERLERKDLTAQLTPTKTCTELSLSGSLGCGRGLIIVKDRLNRYGRIHSTSSSGLLESTG